MFLTCSLSLILNPWANLSGYLSLSRTPFTLTAAIIHKRLPKGAIIPSKDSDVCNYLRQTT